MKHYAELTWFGFHARDLTLPQWLAFRWHALRCAQCGARLDRELAERRAFEGRAPRRWWLALIPLVVAASLLVVLNAPPVEDLTAKGGSRFELWVGGMKALGTHCAAGDALQARAESKRKYLLVLEVDPSGNARVLYPLDGTQSAALAGGPLTLPQSWTLDAAPGRERFVAFFSDAPVSAVDASRAARDVRPVLDGADAIVRECVK
jgi:hypothetical protein